MGLLIIIAFVWGYYLGRFYPTASETLEHIKGLPKKIGETIKKPKVDVISPSKKFREELFNKDIGKEDSDESSG